MGTMFIRSRVEDFATWKAVYDEMAAPRKEFGLSEVAIYRDVDQANRLTVLLDFDDADDAKAYAESDQLRDAMRRASVQGPPEIWYATR